MQRRYASLCIIEFIEIEYHVGRYAMYRDVFM